MTKVITIFSCANDLHKIVIIRWRIEAHMEIFPRLRWPTYRGGPNYWKRETSRFY